MDRVVKRAEAELISVASRQWLDDIAMSGESLNIDSPITVESLHDTQSRLEGHIHKLQNENRRLKEDVAVKAHRLQEKFHGEISEQGLFVGTLDNADAPFPELAAASPIPGGYSGRDSVAGSVPPPPDDFSDL